MGFYWGICAYGIFCTLLNKFLKDKISKRFFTFAFFFILLVFSALRVNIGTDYDGHYQIYKELSRGNLKIGITEPFYMIINLLCINLNLGFPVVVAISSFFTLYPIYRISQNENKPLLLLFYFLQMYLIGYCLIRQYMAISFEIYGVYLWFYKNKRKHGFIFMLLGCCVHVSMWIFVFVFLVSKIFKVKNSITIVLSVVIFLISLRTNLLLDFVFSLAKKTKYGVYTDVMNKDNKAVELGTGLGVVLRIITYYILYYLNSKNKDNLKYNNFFNFLFLALAVSDALSLKIMILTRLRFVFQIALFMPLFDSELNLKKNYLYSLSNVLLVLLFLAYLVTYKGGVEWGNLPYQSIVLSKMSVN